MLDTVKMHGQCINYEVLTLIPMAGSSLKLPQKPNSPRTLAKAKKHCTLYVLCPVSTRSPKSHCC